jgi:hypothetical protein
MSGLIQYPTDRELDLADFVDYCILLVGLISLGFWLLKRRPFVTTEEEKDS